MRIDSIDPSEKIVITFDFSAALETGEVLSGLITTTVIVSLGADETPERVLNGVSTFDVSTKKVLVPVKGGLVDRDYAIKVVVETTNYQKVLALVAHLPIRQEI